MGVIKINAFSVYIYDGVTDGEYFWQYAASSPFCDEILRRKASFGSEERAAKEAAASEILIHADKIVASENTFSKCLQKA